MGGTGTLKQVLKRGALVTAANWQVVIVQFIADALFKTLLTVPLVGGVFLVVLLVGGDPTELLSMDPRHAVPAITSILLAQPIALAAFLAALGLVLGGGSLLMFLVKGGTVTVLLAGERSGGALEQPPLRLAAVHRAASFSLERFTGGARLLFARYVRLGLALCAVYLTSAAIYLAIVFGPLRATEQDWTVLAAVASLALVGWITAVNFLYLLIQIVIAADECDVRTAVARVGGLLRAESRTLVLVFGAILALVTMTTAASILATAALGLIAFVPLVSLAALPLQLLAWLLRGLVFQFIALSGLAAYARVHRGALDRSGAHRHSGPNVHHIGRTA
ncbi:MAG: hypothetical protein LC791_20215 [Acidobacteria bacterium]|nr:hypothetical protein [Acidobacteriota bacterium]